MSNKMYALGPAGTNGHEAAKTAMEMLFASKQFERGSLDVTFCARNENVLERVRDEPISAGVVPIENSTTGLVRAVIDFWLQRENWEKPVWGGLNVVGEIVLPIHHCLLANKGITDASQLTGVISHEQALQQCAKNLDLLGITKRDTASSTGASAKEIAGNPDKKNVGAIAGSLAAEIYGLTILKDNLQDKQGNTTRFHLLGHHRMEPTGNDRTAAIFWVPNKPRAKVNVEWAIGIEDVNMSVTHSIPLGPMGEIAHYVEFDCHHADARGQQIMKIMKLLTTKIVVLGSYPQNSVVKGGN